MGFHVPSYFFNQSPPERLLNQCLNRHMFWEMPAYKIKLNSEHDLQGLRGLFLSLQTSLKRARRFTHSTQFSICSQFFQLPTPSSNSFPLKHHFPHPASVYCLPSITVCVPSSPVSQLPCFVLSAAPLDLLLSGKYEVCSLHPQGLSHELLQGTQDAWRQTERILTALRLQPGEGTPAAPSVSPRPFGFFSIFLSMDTSLPSKCSGVGIPSMTGSHEWIIFKDTNK